MRREDWRKGEPLIPMLSDNRFENAAPCTCRCCHVVAAMPGTLHDNRSAHDDAIAVVPGAHNEEREDRLLRDEREGERAARQIDGSAEHLCFDRRDSRRNAVALNRDNLAAA